MEKRKQRNLEDSLVWIYLALILISVAMIVVLYVRQQTSNTTIQNNVTRIEGLVHENRILLHKQHEILKSIQQSRLEFCKRNYKSFQDVFDPLIPKSQKQTPQYRKFLKNLQKLISRCQRQIGGVGLGNQQP